MPVVPFATFMAGALLTLLLPVLLLIALVVWYWWFSVRVPETADVSKHRAEPAAANAGPSVPENLPPEPGV